MPKILIVNTPGLQNRGGMAAVMGSLRSLREALPDAQVTVLCHHCKEDWTVLDTICRRYNAEVKRHPWFKEHDSRLVSLCHSALPAIVFSVKCVLSRIGDHVRSPKGPYRQVDVVLDLNIDALHDNYGIFFPSWALANILSAKIAGKRVVVWSAGIGGFHRSLTRGAARFILNRVDVIITREGVSEQYLKSLRISRPRIYVTADHAFIMEPATQLRTDEILTAERITKGKNPLIGISASQLIPKYAFPGIKDTEEKHRRYVEVMARAVDYVVKELDATAILIPHSTVPFEDDRFVSAEIREHVEDKDRVRVIGEYMADELKGIIGQCDMFIGARMHSTIASTSMGVPTVAVVYGQKSHGIIGTMMGQGDYVVEIAKYSPDELLSELKAKIDRSWANREAIRRELDNRSREARRRALLNGTLVRDLMNGTTVQIAKSGI